MIIDLEVPDDCLPDKDDDCYNPYIIGDYGEFKTYVNIIVGNGNKDDDVGGYVVQKIEKRYTSYEKKTPQSSFVTRLQSNPSKPKPSQTYYEVFKIENGKSKETDMWNNALYLDFGFNNGYPLGDFKQYKYKFEMTGTLWYLNNTDYEELNTKVRIEKSNEKIDPAGGLYWIKPPLDITHIDAILTSFYKDPLKTKLRVTKQYDHNDISFCRTKNNQFFYAVLTCEDDPGQCKDVSELEFKPEGVVSDDHEKRRICTVCDTCSGISVQEDTSSGKQGTKRKHNTETAETDHKRTKGNK